MSDLPKKPPFGDDASRASEALDQLVDEAKQDFGPALDEAAFAAMEARIVARMAKERSPLVEEAGVDGRGRILRIGAIVLAAAAAVALIAKRDPSAALLEGAAAIQPDTSAGSLRASEGAGEVRVGGLPVAAGHVLRAGDTVEVDTTRAVLERPRKVTWLLERADAEGAAVVGAAASNVARARVKSAGESLILGLDDGAIEAQVTPVPSGEAFAVDVATSTSLVRVAVHGTHLRVARAGSRVVIDLSEGVVSIGAPPRTGSTYGTLVTAPSHVEFDASNLQGTLRIDHTPSAVRPPVTLVGHEPPVTARADAPVPATPTGPLAAASPPAPEAVAAAGAPPAAALATVPRPGAPALAGPKPDDAKPSAAAPDTRSPAAVRAGIAAAVRDCAAARQRPDNVRVSVLSTLRLKIGEGGAVDVARFDPPLLPEIQTCAATAIYKAKLDDASGGTVTIPIDFSY